MNIYAIVDALANIRLWMVWVWTLIVWSYRTFMIWVDYRSHPVHNLIYALTREGLDRQGWSKDDLRLQNIFYWWSKPELDGTVSISIDVLRSYYGKKLQFVGSDGNTTVVNLDDSGSIIQYGTNMGQVNIWGKLKLGANPFTTRKRRRRVPEVDTGGSGSAFSEVKQGLLDGKFDDLGEIFARWGKRSK
jgi:hypothetical protein